MDGLGGHDFRADEVEAGYDINEIFDCSTSSELGVVVGINGDEIRIETKQPRILVNLVVNNILHCRRSWFRKQPYHKWKVQTMVLIHNRRIRPLKTGSRRRCVSNI